MIPHTMANGIVTQRNQRSLPHITIHVLSNHGYRLQHKRVRNSNLLKLLVRSHTPCACFATEIMDISRKMVTGVWLVKKTTPIIFSKNSPKMQKGKMLFDISRTLKLQYCKQIISYYVDFFHEIFV